MARPRARIASLAAAGALVAASPVALGGDSGASAAGSAKGCRGQLVLAQGDVRLVRTGFSAYTYFTCFRSGRRRYVGYEGYDDGVLIPRVADPYVAFDSVRCLRNDSLEGGPQCDARIFVINARTGKRRVFREKPAYSRAYDLELSRTGAVAWIRPTGKRAFEVRRGDARGQAIVAQGSDIDMRSLAISGHRIYWMQGGKPRTEVLKRRDG